MSVRLYVCRYVFLYVCQVEGETWFSRPLYKIELSFFYVHIPLVWASILQIFCPSVCRSGYKRQMIFATYGCCHSCLFPCIASYIYIRRKLLILLLLPYTYQPVCPEVRIFTTSTFRHLNTNASLKFMDTTMDDN